MVYEGMGGVTLLPVNLDNSKVCICSSQLQQVLDVLTTSISYFKDNKI